MAGNGLREFFGGLFGCQDDYIHHTIRVQFSSVNARIVSRSFLSASIWCGKILER